MLFDVAVLVVDDRTVEAGGGEFGELEVADEAAKKVGSANCGTSYVEGEDSRARDALLAGDGDDGDVRASLADVANGLERAIVSGVSWIPVSDTKARTYRGWISWSSSKRVPSTSLRIRWTSSARGRGLLSVARWTGESKGVGRGESKGVEKAESVAVDLDEAKEGDMVEDLR